MTATSVTVTGQGVLPFDPSWTYRVLRPLSVSGRALAPGSVLPVEEFPPEIRKRRVEALCRQRLVAPELPKGSTTSPRVGDELEQMTAKELRLRCRRLGLSSTGYREDYVERIRQAVGEILRR